MKKTVLRKTNQYILFHTVRAKPLPLMSCSFNNNIKLEKYIYILRMVWSISRMIMIRILHNSSN